jgi:hypothetical protein
MDQEINHAEALGPSERLDPAEERVVRKLREVHNDIRLNPSFCSNALSPVKVHFRNLLDLPRHFSGQVAVLSRR